MMYLLFNEYGAIKDKQINEWIVQGSNNVNKIGVAIDGVDPTSFALVGVCKLPNGEVVTTAPVDEQAEIIDGVNGVVFSLGKEITALEGTLRINIQAINTTTDKVITSYTVFLCVNEGVDPGEILMMTADQYQDLLSKIELNIQQDETILTFKSSMPSVSNYSDNQLIYFTPQNEDVGILFIRKTINGSPTWVSVYNFSNHYTKPQINNFLAAKQDKLTRESLPTAQLQYAVGFDAQGNLSKGAGGGGGGGAIYNAGTGIDITNFTISIDDTVVATKSFVSETYATKTELETVKKNAFIKVNTTTYPTLASFLLSTGEEGYIYLYPIDTTDLTKGYYQYIWEDNAWLGIGTTRIDLSNYVDLDSAQTITGEKTIPVGKKLNFGNYKVVSGANNELNLLFGTSASSLIFISGNTAFNSRLHINPGANNTYNLGNSGNKWKEGFINKITDANGSYSSDNVFNVINVSEMTDATHFTQAQYDLITNGKPTRVVGSLFGLSNIEMHSVTERSNDVVGIMICNENRDDFNSSIYRFYINKTTLLITKESSGLSIGNGGYMTGKCWTWYVDGPLFYKSKMFPLYKSDTTKQYKFVQKVGGNLDYVEDITESITTQSTGGATSIQLKTWVGTQAQYDSITTKDANTQYIII